MEVNATVVEAPLPKASPTERFNVPPLVIVTVRPAVCELPKPLPAGLAAVSLIASTKVAPLMTTLFVKVLVAVTVSVPEPFTCNPPPPEMMPESVWLAALLYAKMPLSEMVPI